MKKINAIVLLLSGLMLFACKSNVSEAPNEVPTGAITGKVTYSNYDNSSGIFVILDKTDGSRAIQTVRSVSLQESPARSLADSTFTSNDGSFLFDKLEDGTYTVCALSSITKEKAIAINLKVENGKTVDAGQLSLIATGSISGSVIRDCTASGNIGFEVCIAGTSFSSTTDDNGSYTICDIPAGTNYKLVISKGAFTRICDSTVTVKANDSVVVDTENVSSAETEEIDAIIYKNRYLQGSYKPVLAISDVVEKIFPYYYTKDEFEEIALYMPVNKADNEQLDDIPYVDFEEFAGFTKDEDKSNNEIFVYTRENGANVVFDTVNQTVYCSNYDALVPKPSSLLGIVADDGYIKRTQNPSLSRNGKPIIISLKSYGISTFTKNDRLYIPLQTFNDICGTVLLFNKNAVYENYLAKDFYEGEESHERSDLLKDFNYKEFCLRMDLQYGLKESHNITSFDEFFNETHLINDFYGSPADSIKALRKLQFNYLADFHTGLTNYSYYNGPKYLEDDVITGDYFLNRFYKENEYFSLRKSICSELNTYKGSVLDYREVGDTAYITFDKFIYLTTDYSSIKEEKGYFELSDVQDTVGLVLYADQEIRKHQNIKNVVVDISINGGGEVNALVYLNSWLQDYTELILRDSITGAIEANVYYIDTDFDTYRTYKDSLQGLKQEEENPRDLNLYCVVSEVSFSCGNLLPALLKFGSNVTLIGRTSGGGACIVGNGCTADSSVFQISSNLQLGTIKNGSFYIIDKGIEPDYFINDFKNVYDRVAFNEYLDSLK